MMVYCIFLHLCRDFSAQYPWSGFHGKQWTRHQCISVFHHLREAALTRHEVLHICKVSSILIVPLSSLLKNSARVYLDWWQNKGMTHYTTVFLYFWMHYSCINSKVLRNSIQCMLPIVNST